MRKLIVRKWERFKERNQWFNKEYERAGNRAVLGLMLPGALGVAGLQVYEFLSGVGFMEVKGLQASFVLLVALIAGGLGSLYTLLWVDYKERRKTDGKV